VAVPLNRDVPATPASVSTSRGALFLGGNRMSPPYELSYVGGRFAVNGFALPPPKPPAPFRIHYSAEERAEIAFGQRVGDVLDSLRAAGVSPGGQGEFLRSMCIASPLVDSVAVTSRAVALQFHGGGRYFPRRLEVELAGKWCPPAHPFTRAQRESVELEQTRDLLEEGCTIFILNSGSRVEAIEDPDKMVARALAGKLPGSTLEAELRSPVPLERVK
jgi:hypothetical protein